MSTQQNDWSGFVGRTYEEFINNIIETRGRFNCGDEYHERHHIVPRCMSGTDDENNLVDLFAREHFIAHKLLALENPDNDSLLYAWWMMSHSTSREYQERYEVTPNEYEEAKKAFSKMRKQQKASDETRKKISKNHIDVSGKNNPMYGKRHSNETKIKISESRKGKYAGINSPTYGKCWDEGRRKRQSEIIKKKYEDPEERAKISRAIKEWVKDESVRARISNSVKQRWNDDEIRKKYIENHADVSGGNNPRAKPVICIETKHIYEAASIASDKTGISKVGIRSCCNEVCKTSGGYRWRFIYDTTRRDGTFIPGAITLGLITEQEVEDKLKT